MHNPFIPKDNYISRIADRLKKEEIESYFIAQCNRLGVNPKYIKLMISDDVDLYTKDLIKETYCEFIENGIKSLEDFKTKEI